MMITTSQSFTERENKEWIGWIKMKERKKEMQQEEDIGLEKEGMYGWTTTTTATELNRLSLLWDIGPCLRSSLSTLFLSPFWSWTWMTVTVTGDRGRERYCIYS